MKLLKKYLLIKYSETFFPIFLTLFTITSIIFLVKIASLTSVIQINFFELLELFSYSAPKILFYTLPISVFVSLVLTLSKLSSEYELIVITSFGLNPIKILKQPGGRIQYSGKNAITVLNKNGEIITTIPKNRNAQRFQTFKVKKINEK